MKLDLSEKKLIDLALQEDLGSADITSLALFRKKSPKVKAIFLAKEPLILAGIKVAQAVFEKVDSKVKFKILKKDGSECSEGDEIAVVEGSGSSILIAERTALNFLQQLSGVATQTYLFVKTVEGTDTKILDTRKTLPGWRSLQKYAVKVGGGHNHRMGLYDAYLIKDNHLALYGSITKAIEAVRKHNKKKKKIEIEVTNIDQLDEALRAKPDWILLDNMTLEDMRLAVIQRNQIVGATLGSPSKRVRQAAPLLEASGNVNLDNVRSVAETGVDYISIGALTHSAPAVDISLEIISQFELRGFRYKKLHNIP